MTIFGQFIEIKLQVRNSLGFEYNFGHFNCKFKIIINSKIISKKENIWVTCEN